MNLYLYSLHHLVKNLSLHILLPWQPPLDLVNMRALQLQNSESMSYLKKIDNKIDNVELKLKTLDNLEKKVDTFEKDMKNCGHV